MTIDMKCFEKAFVTEREKYDPNSYFPLVMAHHSLASISCGVLFGETVARYCPHHYIINRDEKAAEPPALNLMEARRRISASLHPINNINLNYCVAAYYPPDGALDLDAELDSLKDIELHASFSENYIRSLILIIDAKVDAYDDALTALLKKAEDVGCDANVYTYNENFSAVDVNLNTLLMSVVSQILYTSSHKSGAMFNEKREEARKRNEIHLRSIPSWVDSNRDRKMVWQSTCARFISKKHDLTVEALKIVFANIAVLTEDTIHTKIKDVYNWNHITVKLTGLLAKTFSRLPTIHKADFSPRGGYTFRDICSYMFGSGGYATVRISFKTTTALFIQNGAEKDGEAKLIRFLKDLVCYRCDNFAVFLTAAINKYITEIEARIAAEYETGKGGSRPTYEGCLKRVFEKNDQITVSEVVHGFIAAFLRLEELNAQLAFWKSVALRIDEILDGNPELVGAAKEFDRINKALYKAGTNYRFVDLHSEKLHGFTIDRAIRAHGDGEFIEELQKLYELYAGDAKVNEQSAVWDFVFSYKTIAGITSETDLFNDYGLFEVIGRQKFSEYWAFSKG
jgi:hypothetical protein